MTDYIAVVNTVYLCRTLDSTNPSQNHNALHLFLYHILVSPFPEWLRPLITQKTMTRPDPNHFPRCLPYLNSQSSILVLQPCICIRMVMMWNYGNWTLPWYPRALIAYAWDMCSSRSTLTYSICHQYDNEERVVHDASTRFRRSTSTLIPTVL